MLKYVIRRLLIMIPTLLVISMISFIIITLPPGDYITRYINQMRQEGTLNPDQVKQLESLRARYGLDKPIYVQYSIWFSKFIRGDLGYSWEFKTPVSKVVWERLALTLIVTGSAMLFTWVLAFPIGFYSAVKQHTIGDYIATFIGFAGLAIPNFMLALFFVYMSFTLFGEVIGGLFSPQFMNAPWSFAKMIDLLKHLWIPTIVIGTAGTAGLIRILRNNLLDELQKPYVLTARAKGLNELKLLLRYPVRIAINPFISTVGWLIPRLISGASIVSIVLGLPTAGGVLIGALQAQDMYLAGALIMLMAVLTVIGTLVSDILLAMVDPRIRYD